ncbi:MAG: HlyD family secretion protein [Planctomycetales bacterium]
MIQRLGIISLLILLLIAGLVYSQRRTGPLKVSGFIESDEIRVGSRVGGRVSGIFVEEGQTVRKGERLVELEPFQLHEQRSQLQGEFSQAQAEWDRLQTGYREEEIAGALSREAELTAAREQLADGEEDIAAARANLELAQSQLDLAQLKYDRTEKLIAKNNASQSDFDQATAELRVARATVQVRQEELGKLVRYRPLELKAADARRDEAHQEWLLRSRGYRDEDKAKAAAAVASAQGALQAIERQIEELTIRAPAAGVIEAIDLRPGDLVGANTPAVSMIEADRLWVRAYVPENHLDVQVGRKVVVTVDAFQGARLRKFTGKVTFVARQAEFTPGNVQTPEERSKQVFRIKVVLEDGHEVLRPGMMADVWLKGEADGV